jgi:predicted GIY-YIG superfamily endonuclease
MTIVYLLQSMKDPTRYYVGRTTDLPERLKQHNSAEYGHTLKFRPWKLIVSIAFEDPVKAEAFEHYLKSGSGRAFAKKHF